MRILAIGDIVGERAVEELAKQLPEIIKKNRIDFTIANAENAANGIGLTRELFNKIIEAGAEVVTMGNHTWGKQEIYDFIDDNKIIRPANITKGMPGKGYTIIQKGNNKIVVINLIGRRMMEGVYDSNNPFIAVEEILKEIEEDIKIIIVDFHAQSTGEKFNMAYFLDGKVSAVYGTHTHVQTADEVIMPKGTAFITDIGMAGACLSSLGCEVEDTLKSYLEDKPLNDDTMSTNPIMINGCLFDIDETTGKAQEIKRIHIN